MTKDELKEKLSQISSDKDIYKKVKKFYKLCYTGVGEKHTWKSFVEYNRSVASIIMNAGCWSNSKNELGTSFFVELYGKASDKGL